MGRFAEPAARGRSVLADTQCRPTSELRYLQSGQPPEDATLVAAAAAVLNSAVMTAASPNSFIFIRDLLLERVHPAQ